jgi:hypothetical protein
MISSRSVRALAALVLAASLFACGKSKKETSGPFTSPSGGGSGPQGGPAPEIHAPRPGSIGICPTITGSYQLAFKTSCGSQGWGWVDAEQNGCDITLNLKQLAVIKGRLDGDAANVSLTFQNPCGGAGSGLVTVSGDIIAGSFSGVQSGTEVKCCTPVSGTFTLTKTK